MESSSSRPPYHRHNRDRSRSFVPYGTAPPSSNIQNGSHNHNRGMNTSMQYSNQYRNNNNTTFRSRPASNFSNYRRLTNNFAPRNIGAGSTLNYNNRFPQRAYSNQMPSNALHSHQYFNPPPIIPANSNNVEKPTIDNNSTDESTSSLSDEENLAPTNVIQSPPNIEKQVCVALSIQTLYKNGIFAPNIFSNSEFTNGLDAVSYIVAALTNYNQRRTNNK